MPAETAERFRTAMTSLLRRRELAGGALTQDQESEAVAELDDIWWELSNEEQNELDREFLCLL